MSQINVAETPALDTKIKRLEDLRSRFEELQEEQEKLIEEAYELTGESREETMGHTFDFIANNFKNETAAELLADIENNPSELWGPIRESIERGDAMDAVVTECPPGKELDALRGRYRHFDSYLERILSRALEITGEENLNGRTLNFLSGPDLQEITGDELLARYF